MPLVRVLDPGDGPLHFFGAELRLHGLEWRSFLDWLRKGAG